MLRVSEQQVRRLASAGALPAQRLGAAWLVGADGVRARARSEHVAGRPVSPRMAWEILRVVQTALDAGGAHPVDAAGRAGDAAAEAIAVAQDRRMRYRLRSLLAAAPPVERWPGWLRHRASAWRVWVHPGVLHRLETDPRLRIDGITFARRPGGARNAYVEGALLDAIVAAYRAQPAPDGDIRLMAISAAVPGHLIPPPGLPLPSAVSLVDALADVDARPRHLAVEVLDDARRSVQEALHP